MDIATTTILCTTAAGLGVNLLQYFREARAHQWMVEQSDRDREERLCVAENLRQQHVVIADKTTAQISAKIDENTDISREAFREANDVNKKIAAIGGMQIQSAQADRIQADRIERVGDNTNKMVHELEKTP